MASLSRPAQLLVLSQLVQAVFLAICVVIMPRYLLGDIQGGVSNYGVEAATIVPFSIGFLWSSYLVYRAAAALPRQTKRRDSVVRALLFISLLFVMVTLSTYTYKLSGLLNAVHTGAAVALFLMELGLAGWFVFVLSRRLRNFVFLGVFTAGFALALLTFIGVLHLLFIAEVLTNLAFGLIMISAVADATE